MIQNNLYKLLLASLLSFGMVPKVLALGAQKNWSISLTGIGITVHGKTPGPLAKPKLDNKIGSSGRWAYNPQVGVIVRKGYFQGAAVYLKDCFNNNAGLVGIGPQVQLGYVTFGSLFGAYARKVPSSDTFYVGDGKGHTTATVVQVNNLPLSKKVGKVEIAPMAAATVSVEIPMTKHISLEFNGAVNVYLNHFNTGLRFNF